MTIPTLGTLIEAPLREAWNHEAHSFTPWLATNLDALASTIGIPLELEGQEIAVETFSADILARNPMDDSLVLIENQLEGTDHTHLGQIMTYLAGLEAQTVVWIAAEFRDAHLSALKWLNEHTVEPFAFFAIKVKAVRIGDSSIAPVFEVLGKPNQWERQLQAIASEKLSELGQFRKAFWTHYLEKYPDERVHGRAGGESSRWRVLTDLGLVVGIYLAKSEVGVFIRGPRGSVSAEVYDTIVPYLDQLAGWLGAAPGNLDRGQFFVSSYKAKTSDPACWDELSQWLYNTANKYELMLKDLMEGRDMP